MKRIHEQFITNRAAARHSFAAGSPESVEAVEDHQSNQEAPEDHSRDDEGRAILHERMQGRHLG